MTTNTNPCSCHECVQFGLSKHPTERGSASMRMLAVIMLTLFIVLGLTTLAKASLVSQGLVLSVIVK